jgi:hypothetical protein
MNPTTQYNNVATNYEHAVITKHVEVSTMHAVTLAEPIIFWPDQRDTLLQCANVYIRIKLK